MIDLMLLSGWLLVHDPAASDRLYHGPPLGLRLDVVGATVHGGATLQAGRLAGYGARRFEVTGEDVLTGEPYTYRLRIDPTVFSGRAELGVADPLGAVLWSEARYTSGYANNLWGWTATRLGPQLRLGDDDAALRGDVRMSLVSLVTRMPYSMNPIDPDKSLVGGFMSQTRARAPWQHLAVEGGVKRRFGDWFASARVSMAVDVSPVPLVMVEPLIGFGRSL